jgi:hypothetical protein
VAAPGSGPGTSFSPGALRIRSCLSGTKLSFVVFLDRYGADLDPDPTSDPTPFFSDFKDAKKNIFQDFFLNLPTGTSSSVLEI